MLTAAAHLVVQATAAAAAHARGCAAAGDAEHAAAVVKAHALGLALLACEGLSEVVIHVLDASVSLDP